MNASHPYRLALIMTMGPNWAALFKSENSLGSKKREKPGFCQIWATSSSKSFAYFIRCSNGRDESSVSRFPQINDKEGGLYKVKKYVESASRWNGIAATVPTMLAISQLNVWIFIILYARVTMSAEFLYDRRRMDMHGQGTIRWIYMSKNWWPYKHNTGSASLGVRRKNNLDWNDTKYIGEIGTADGIRGAFWFGSACLDISKPVTRFHGSSETIENHRGYAVYNILA